MALALKGHLSGHTPNLKHDKLSSQGVCLAVDKLKDAIIMQFFNEQRHMADKNKTSQDAPAAVRIDKWLWAARFYKTRSIARQMVDGGKVDYNGSKAKPSRAVEVGATIKLLQGFSRKEVIVKAISDVRGPASVAATLYEETAESIARREEEARLNKAAALLNPRPDTKPNKKERRELESLKHSM